MYLVVASRTHIDIMLLNIGGGIPTLVHIKKMKITADCICQSQDENGFFYAAQKTKIAKFEIDLANP